VNPTIIIATARRVLSQLRRDPRTLAMALIVPTVLMVLLRRIFHKEGQFDAIAPPLLAILPFLVMFLITSVSTLRERTSGTLERLLTLPTAKLDLLIGYAIAFGLLALAQVGLAVGVSSALGLDINGPLGMLFVVAALNALLGTALGLLVSAFARTEFQAVQFMPLVIAPQLLLCGIIVPRDVLPGWLHAISNVMPASYALEALRDVGANPELTGTAARDIAIVVAFAVLALALAAATLRRRTP
jgi:ABC-2 type transport system permease protein